MKSIESNNQKKTVTQSRDRTKLNLFLDIGLALFFAVEMEVHFTGLALHELLGLLFTAVLVIHVVLHWDWVVSITRTFFRKLIHESRLNYVLNLALLIDVIVVTVTGIVVSETLGLKLGLSAVRITDLQTIHAYSSHLSLVLTALHVALHWKWIATNTAKYLFHLPPPNSKTQPTLQRRRPAMPTQRESESLP